MKDTILFNANTSANAEHNLEWNRLYLRTISNYVDDLLKVKGHIYLNQIYEMLGVKWDPQRDNPCCIYVGKYTEFKFDVRSVDEGFEIDVSW